jgi:hypothetical protein
VRFSLAMVGVALASISQPRSREPEAFWGRFRKIFVPEDPTGWNGPTKKGCRIRMVQKASGAGPAKSLKVEAAKASNQPGPQSKGFGPAVPI